MTTQKSRKYIFILVPLVVISTLCFILYSGLSINPYTTSVKIVDIPLPKTKGTDLYQWNNIISIKDFTNLKPKRWFIINVWASWCETCMTEHPFLVDLARQGITIYGINYNDSAISAKKWLSSYGNPYISVIWDARGIVSSAFKISSVPTSFLVDSNGRIRCVINGPLTPDVWKNTLIPFIEKNETKPNASPSKQ